MTIEETEQWFGNLHQACLALGIAPQNMTKWKKKGYIPWKQQFKLAVITEGKLMPDDQDPCEYFSPKQHKTREIK